jgi:Flp pilus assembly protein protease CpaA
VKLLAALGSLLGWHAGLEALVWAMVIGAAAAVVRLIMRRGVVSLLTSVGQHVWYALRVGHKAPYSSDEQAEMSAPLSLGPATAVAVAAVLFQLPDRLMLVLSSQ